MTSSERLRTESTECAREKENRIRSGWGYQAKLSAKRLRLRLTTAWHIPNLFRCDLGNPNSHARYSGYSG